MRQQPGNVTYGYDAAGRRTSMADTGTTSYQYDSLGRLTSSTNGAGAQVGYGYDKSSRLTSIVYPGTTGTVTRAYDSAGRLGSVRDWLSHTTSFKYDADSNLVEQDYANSAVGCRTYDAADRLTGIINTLGPNPLCLAGLPTQFLALSYGRDNIGQLATDSGKSYAYDPTNRLSTAATSSITTYGYDNADRITSMAVSGGGNASTLAYDNGDQVQSLTVTNAASQLSKNTYGFDGRGNRTSVAVQSGATTALAYDQANRLVAYGATATYAYNGDGLRMSKTVSGTAEAFTWDVAEGLPLILQDGTTNYVTGPGGLPLEQINGTSVYYYHADQLGSTRAMTDSAGAVQQTYEFDPYGNQSTSTGTLTNPLQYAGQYRDPESSLYYMRARYYDPTTTQFVTRDPLVAVTRAAYQYANGTPLNEADATGLGACLGPVCIPPGALPWVLGRAGAATRLLGPIGILIFGISIIYDAKGGAFVPQPVGGRAADDPDYYFSQSAVRSIDDVLANKDICDAFLRHKFDPKDPYSSSDAQKIWKELEKRGMKPRLDSGHPGTQWEAPHINSDVGNIHIPVDPGFVAPKS